MLYLSGYINNCLTNSFDVISIFFNTLNSYIIPEEDPTFNDTTSNFYNYSNLSKLEEVVICEQPVYKRRRTRSDPNIKLILKEETIVKPKITPTPKPKITPKPTKIEVKKIKKDDEWDIL
jgi:hypothetical protein